MKKDKRVKDPSEAKSTCMMIWRLTVGVIFVSFLCLPNVLDLFPVPPGMCICDSPFWIICGEPDEIWDAD